MGTTADQNRDQRHDIRRLAMQLLFQLGNDAPADAAALHALVDDVTPDEADGLFSDPPAVTGPAVALALNAWAAHDASDARVTQLAPDWPTHRQPGVDRAILRLAVYEVTSGRVPIGVAINEAIELAKVFAAENSPAFVNGVLDKLAKQLAGETAATPDDAPTDHASPDAPAATPVTPPVAPPVAPKTGDDWLDDAMAQ